MTKRDKTHRKLIALTDDIAGLAQVEPDDTILRQIERRLLRSVKTVAKLREGRIS